MWKIFNFLNKSKEIYKVETEQVETEQVETEQVETEQVETEQVEISKIEEKLKYYINFYTNKQGDKVRGEWKLTEDDINIEKNSHLYTVKLNLHWTHTAMIDRDEAQKIADESNMTLGEALSCF